MPFTKIKATLERLIIPAKLHLEDNIDYGDLRIMKISAARSEDVLQGSEKPQSR